MCWDGWNAHCPGLLVFQSWISSSVVQSISWCWYQSDDGMSNKESTKMQLASDTGLDF
jgi:hypothetical protein